jgi:hypothetical protein
MPRQAEHFDAAYGPLLQKWGAHLGKDRLKELVADLSLAIQKLLKEDADEIAAKGGKEHAATLHASIASFEKWRHENI